MSHGRCLPHSSMRQAKVRIVAISCPGVPDAAAGRDPQDLGREAEQDRQSQPVEQAARRRSAPAASSTARRPAAASTALIPDSIWSAVTAPMTATSGMKTTAGNGANGT